MIWRVRYPRQRRPLPPSPPLPTVTRGDCAAPGTNSEGDATALAILTPRPPAAPSSPGRPGSAIAAGAVAAKVALAVSTPTKAAGARIAFTGFLHIECWPQRVPNLAVPGYPLAEGGHFASGAKSFQA